MNQEVIIKVKAPERTEEMVEEFLRPQISKIFNVKECDVSISCESISCEESNEKLPPLKRTFVLPEMKEHDSEIEALSIILELLEELEKPVKQRIMEYFTDSLVNEL